MWICRFLCNYRRIPTIASTYQWTTKLSNKNPPGLLHSAKTAYAHVEDKHRMLHTAVLPRCGDEYCHVVHQIITVYAVRILSWNTPVMQSIAPHVDKGSFLKTSKFGSYFNLCIGVCQTSTLPTIHSVVAVELIYEHENHD